MSTERTDTDEETSPANQSPKLDTDRTRDPDLDLSYAEAVERDEFRYARVFSRVDQPTDFDGG